MLKSRLNQGRSHRHHYGSSRRMRLPRLRLRSRRRSSRGRRRWTMVAGLVLVAVLAGAGLYGYTLYQSVGGLKDKAEDATSQLTAYVKAATSGDADKIKDTASSASATAHEIQDELASPLWVCAQFIPVVGSDVHSVRVLGDVLVDVADNALVPLAKDSGALSLSTLMSNSEVNVSALRDLLSAIEMVAPIISRSAKSVGELPQPRIKQLTGVLEPLRVSLRDLDSALDQMSPLYPHLPTMVGADGQTKTYMVLAQNNAEVHATGGFVGWVGYLVMTDGHIELRDFQSVTKVLGKDHEPAGATQEEIALFDGPIDAHVGDHNMTPDFVRAGQMYHGSNMRANQENVDGVLAVDPVFLQYMLELVGPIDTSFGVKVDGTNAASVVLNQCLFWWSPATCDDFYEEVSNTAFHKVLDELGSVDTVEFLSTLGKGAQEGRCMLWVQDINIEEAVQKAGFAGELSHNQKAPVTGVYFNDRSTSKAAYYLSAEAQVGQPSTNEDGSKSYHVQLSIKNNMNRGLIAGGLPGYLKVGRDDNRSVADLYEDAFLIAPEGGSLEIVSSTRLNSTVPATSEITWNEASYQGLQTFKCGLRVDADEIVVISYNVTTSPEAKEPLHVRITPLVPEEIAYW